MKTLLIAVLFFAFTTSSSSQPSITWNRLYNGPYNWHDESYDLCQTSDSNFIAVGYTRNPNYSICALKINGFGDTLWFRIFPSKTDIFKTGYSVAKSNDGGCYLTGFGDSLFVAKIDINGNVTWINYYGSQVEKGFDIFKTNENKYIICGDYGLVLKIDENGNKLWKKYLNATRLNRITNGIDGGYIITGSIRIGSDISRALLIKIDTAGNQIWTNNYLINNSSTSVSVDALNHSYVFSGRTKAILGDLRENFILKTDIKGNEIYRKIFKSDKSEYFNDFVIINDNRYAICSDRDSNIINPSFFLSKIILIDSAGEIIIDKTFNFAGSQSLNSITKVSNGDLVFCGSSRPISAGGIDDIWIIRTDSNLNSPIVNIGLINSEELGILKLQQNFPNPFNMNSKIGFEVKINCKVKIIIFNLLGQIIETIINKDLNAGYYEINFDGTSLNSSIYFCSLFINDALITTNKMLLIK